MFKAGISGVRGVWGETLVQPSIVSAAAAVMEWLEKQKQSPVIVLGGDSRKSTASIKEIFTRELIALGADLIDVGLAPTPTIQFLTKRLGGSVGIAVTASHNPAEWNGWKLIRPDGIFFLPEEMQAWITLWKQSITRARPGTGSLTLRPNAQFEHLEKILANVDVAKIRARQFRVAVDSCNGAGSILLPRILELLGCDVVAIANDPTKPFPRSPEPLPENLGALGQAVVDAHADIGLAQDADADRLAIVDEHGKPIGEELTLALAVKHVLTKNREKIQKPCVVINLSTSQTTEDVARALGAEVIRTPVGEINVVQEMIKQNALIGGEGNGGVIYPAVGLARDSLTAAALVLEFLAEAHESVSAAVQKLPRYESFKKKIEAKSPEQLSTLFAMVETEMRIWGVSEIDRRDGLWIRIKDGWLHVRASNTEPIIRIMGESRNRQELEKLIQSF